MTARCGLLGGRPRRALRASRTCDSSRASQTSRTSGPNLARRPAFTCRTGHTLRARGPLLASGASRTHLTTVALRAGATGHTLRSDRALRPSGPGLAARAGSANRATLTSRPRGANGAGAARGVHQQTDHQRRGRRDDHIAIKRVRRHPLLELVHINPDLHDPPTPRSARLVGR